MLARAVRQLFATRPRKDSFAYRVADPSPDHEALDSLRNIDYQARRKGVLRDFNLQLVTRNQHYQAELREKGPEGQQQEQQQFQLRTRAYKDSIDVLSQQLSQQLGQIDREEKTNTVKIYLTDNSGQEGQPVALPASPGDFYIPNRLVLKKLYQCPEGEKGREDPSQQVLLVGVEGEEEHCLFLARLVEELEVSNLVTMVPPDLPYFIKTEGSFLEEWRHFIENPDHARKSKFYVNPRPRVLEDVCLQAHHFPLVREALARSSAFLDTHYYLLKQDELQGHYEPLPLLGGLCSQTLSRIYLGDYPIFQERKMLADSMQLAALRQLFQEFLANSRQRQSKFSAQWLFPPEILRKKLGHVVGVAKAVARQGRGRTLVVCPAEVAELVGLEWQMGRGGDLFGEEGPAGEQTFMEHIEKLVILDLITEPVITRYFVKYRSFPFLCEHTLGGRENIGKVFIVWMHFYNLYHQQLSEKRLEGGEQARLRQAFMDRYEEPSDFT